MYTERDKQKLREKKRKERRKRRELKRDGDFFSKSTGYHSEQLIFYKKNKGGSYLLLKV